MGAHGGGGAITGKWVFFLLLSSLLAACSGTADLLPQRLYFLDGTGDQAQVWRLEREATTRMQMTDEKTGVEDFAVSSNGSRLAIISGNQLIVMDRQGQNRQLIADASQADWQGPEPWFHTTLSDPVFSPDGRMLAYGLDGLHLYDLETGEDRHLLTNLGNLLGEPFVFDREVYAPGAWSPDSSQLLIVMGYYEGSTLAVLQAGAQPQFRRLRSDGPVCCYFSWSDDSRSVLVANPSYSGDIPGLWRFDSLTGQGTQVVPGLGADGSINFTGWPTELAVGELLFFHANLERFSPEAGISLRMVRSDLDGSNLSALRSESFHIIEALWSHDGQFALILHNSSQGGRQLSLVPRDGSPIKVLIETSQVIHNLAWGP